MRRASIEETARGIFGPDDQASLQRWTEYWQSSRQRNAQLLKTFQPLVPLDFEGKRVLDIGCGTGGLGELISDRCRLYVGADFHAHVLALAPRSPSVHYLQCSGLQLPFPDRFFDFLFAFDVIEHLVGGFSWQVQFLKEVRRVLKPTGMALFTTPNSWAPYDGHTELYFPHYLPAFLRDRYIGWRNPGFLKEHNTFAEVPLLSPRKLRRALRKSGLAFLHQLPWGLDRKDHRRLFPLRGLLALMGLGWHLHAEFLGLLVHREMRPKLRLKLQKDWHYALHQPSSEPVRDFGSRIDFDKGLFNPQMGAGWFWHERDNGGFRWTGRRAVCYLQSNCPAPFLALHGFSPHANHLEVHVDGLWVGEHRVGKGEEFRLRYLIPFASLQDRIFEVELHCSRTFRSQDAQDERELGIMIFSIGLQRELRSRAKPQSAKA